MIIFLINSPMPQPAHHKKGTPLQAATYPPIGGGAKETNAAVCTAKRALCCRSVGQDLLQGYKTSHDQYRQMAQFAS